MSTLERAIEIATEAHRGQFDKAGNNYIGHPLRAKNFCRVGLLTQKAGEPAKKQEK